MVGDKRAAGAARGLCWRKDGSEDETTELEERDAETAVDGGVDRDLSYHMWWIYLYVTGRGSSRTSSILDISGCAYAAVFFFSAISWT